MQKLHEELLREIDVELQGPDDIWQGGRLDTIKWLVQRYRELMCFRGDVMAGCDITRGEKLYRQVQVPKEGIVAEAVNHPAHYGSAENPYAALFSSLVNVLKVRLYGNKCKDSR